MSMVRPSDDGGTSANPEGKPFLRLTRELGHGMVVTTSKSSTSSTCCSMIKDKGLGPA